MIAWLASLLPSYAGFAWPWWFLALPLPWIVRRLLPPKHDVGAALKVPYGRRLSAIAGVRGPARARGIGLLATLAWALLCVAAARPQQLGPVVQPPQQGRDLMLAVDLSGSMSDEDMALGGSTVDRLTAAKAVIADFLQRRTGDRIGLIVFGLRAYVLVPLTLDHDTVRQQLQDSAVAMAGRETAIGDAIGLAVKRLSKQPAGERVVVLLTDGVNTAGMLDPVKAAELARDNHVRIHTIAFGGYGAGLSVFGVPIQMPGSDDTTDEAGLKRIAELTGGKAFRARDTDDLAGIYREIERIEPVDRPGEAVRPRVERYPWPLGGARACGLLAIVLPRWRRA